MTNLSSRWRLIAYRALPTLGLLCALVGTECGVRLTRPHRESLDVFVQSPEQHDDFRDRRQVRIFEGDPLLFWRLRPNIEQVVWDFTLVSTNAQGLRHPRPVGPKSPGLWRIVCLGDSVTFGFRVPVVFEASRLDQVDPEALPYPMLAERLLRTANPGRAIEVIAMAVPGYSSHQGLAWLRRDISWLQPDVVTFCFGWNDASLRLTPDSRGMPVGALAVLARAITAQSQALLLLRSWLSPASGPQVANSLAPVPRVSQSDYVANLLAAQQLARRSGARTLVLGSVYRDPAVNPAESERMGAYRTALRHGCEAAGVPYLEFPLLTESAHSRNRYLFGELIHPNAVGHRIMARELLERLAREGSLPGMALPAFESEDPHSDDDSAGPRMRRHLDLVGGLRSSLLRGARRLPPRPAS
jgi:lysophospholipase L1-like esterase